MKIEELLDISQQSLDLINPTTPEKIIAAGQEAGLKTGSQVIDFGCGYGEVLILWAQEFGITGVGIDINKRACNVARHKISEQGLSEHLKIVCGNAAEYEFAPQEFDVAACIGALFIWQNDFRRTLRQMCQAVHNDGKLIIGEAYWSRPQVPPEYSRKATSIHTEHELFQICREEGYTIEWIRRASDDDWDRYESSNWQGLIDWLHKNPSHPERQQVLVYLHERQGEYFRYGRAYFGWMLCVLVPMDKAI